MPKQPGQEITRNASVIAGATFLSRILGFLRDITIAFALGAGPLADAFFVAFRVPNLLRRLFAEGSLTMAFVPVFTQTREKQGIDQAFNLSRSTLIWLMLILGFITAAALIWAGPLTMVIAPGFANEPEVFQKTVTLIRLCFPYIIFISGVALCMGILNSMGHFLSPALAPCILNLCLISAALIGVFTGYSIPILLCIGVLIGGLGQWLLQQPFLSARGFSWKGPWNFKNKGVGRIAKLMLPTVIGAAVYQLNIVMSTVLASLLPRGSISFLYYADRLVQFPLGVLGVAVGTAALPSFSSLIASDQQSSFIETLNFTLGLIFFISLPAMAGLVGLREPLIEVFFGRGAFQLTDVKATSWALFGYALGLPAFCCIRSLLSAFYALQDTRTPVQIACICPIFNVGLGFFLMQYIAHVGLALAVSISSWLNICLLALALRRKVGSWFRWSRGYLYMVFLSLVLAAGTIWTASWGMMALLLIPFWIALYLWAGVLFGLKEAKLLQEVLADKLSGLRGH